MMKHYKEADVNVLLKAGADVNDVNVKDVALGVAVEEENTDAIRFLVQKGADVNHYNKWGRRFLIEAIREGAYKCSLNCLKLLLELGGDVNLQGRMWKETALRAAVGRNEPAFVKAVLDAGADVNQTNCPNESALLEATKGKNLSFLITSSSTEYFSQPVIVSTLHFFKVMEALLPWLVVSDWIFLN